MALGDEGPVGQFLDQPLVDGGLEGEVELLKGTLKGQMGQPGTSGEVAFPTGGYLHAEQFGQQLGIGQLLAGRGVQGVVQNLHGLLEAQGLRYWRTCSRAIMPHLPARTLPASGVPPRRRRICTATASFRGRGHPWAVRPTGRAGCSAPWAVAPGDAPRCAHHRPDLHRALALSHLHLGPYPLPVDAVQGALPADETVPRHLAVLPQVRRQRGPIGQLPQVGRSSASISHGTRWVVPCTRALATTSHHSSPCRFRSTSSVKRMLGHMLRRTLYPVLHLALGLGSVGLRQPSLKTHVARRNPPAGSRSAASLRPAQRDHLGIVVKAPAGHRVKPPRYSKRIDVALDEGRGVRIAHGFGT